MFHAHLLRRVTAIEQRHKVMPQQFNFLTMYVAMHIRVIENSLPTWLETARQVWQKTFRCLAAAHCLRLKQSEAAGRSGQDEQTVTVWHLAAPADTIYRVKSVEGGGLMLLTSPLNNNTASHSHQCMHACLDIVLHSEKTSSVPYQT